MRRRLARYFENLLHLKAVVDAGSINRASTIIGLSQPALTRSIGRLEAAMGAQLLIRVAKGVYPTELGRVLLDHVRLMDDELESAAAKLRVLGRRSGVQITCGGSFIAMSLLLPLAVKAFKRIEPGAQVRLVEASTDDQIRMLRLGELDIAVGPRIGEGDDGSLYSEVLATEQIGIFADRHHSLLKRRDHSLSRLAETETWIMPDRAYRLHPLLTKEFARQSVAMPRRCIETSSLIAVRRLIGVTDCIAITTSLVVAPDIVDGLTKELHGDWRFPTTTMSLFHRAQQSSPTALAFADCLRRAARSLPSSHDTQA